MGTLLKLTDVDYKFGPPSSKVSCMSQMVQAWEPSHRQQGNIAFARQPLCDGTALEYDLEWLRPDPIATHVCNH